MKYFLFIAGLLCTITVMGQQNGTLRQPSTPVDLALVKSDTVKKAMIYTYVEQMATPDFDMRSYLQKSLRYPDSARKHGTEGRVVVKFVINEDGGVSNVAIIRGLGDGCDEEAARVVSQMPQWNPAKQNGKLVKVYYTLPIQFRLDK